MKALLSAVIAAVLVASVARADWKEVKRGMDQKEVAAAVGAPLIMNRGKGGAEVWTYDNRGYIQFQNGRVMWWDAPSTRKQPLSAVAQAEAARKARILQSQRALAMQD